MLNITLEGAISSTRQNLEKICKKLWDIPPITIVEGWSNYALLLGWSQISWSLSPFIHNFSARKDAIPLNYLLLDIENTYRPVKDIIQYIESSEHILWANITMPYKIEVYDELLKKGKLDQSAIIAGSVNTLYKDSQWHLHGMNTDIDGIVNPIIQSITRDSIQNAVILGGWWASRAVIIALIQLWIENISIYNRSLENIKPFVDTIWTHKDILNIPDSLAIDVHEYDVTDESLSDIVIRENSILINTLPFWWKENLPKMPIKTSLLERNKNNIRIVFDIAYTLENIDTPLLQYIKKSYPHIETYDGIDMLVEQAKRWFTAWTWWGAIDSNLIKKIIKKTHIS